MRLLMFYTDTFAWTPRTKVLDDTPEGEAGRADEAIVGFIHVEPEDEGREGKVTTKLVKHLKWLATKNGTTRIVLHSFSHLAEAKASPSLGRLLLDRAHDRLRTAGYEVLETTYGSFVDLEMRAPGHPLARVYKAF